MSDLQIEIVGLDKLMAAFEKFPKKVARTMSQAGHEAANKVILPTEGLQNYPPETSANQPPAPYYERGKGMWTSATRNTYKSENLAKQWYAKREGYKFRIGNRASYARWVHGKEQARAMARIGWRKLFDVAKEKLPRIQKVYQAWVNKLLRELRLL